MGTHAAAQQHTIMSTAALTRAPSWEGAQNRKMKERQERLVKKSTPRTNIEPPPQDLFSKPSTPPKNRLTPLQMRPAALTPPTSTPGSSHRRRRNTLPELGPVRLPTNPKDRKRPSKRVSTVRACAAPPASTVQGSQVDSGKVQIPKKLFQCVHMVFKEHDADGDGIITQDEFVSMVQRAESRKNDQLPECMPRRKVRPSTGEILENQAMSMHESVMRHSESCQQRGGITLVSFMALYFPYLPLHEVERACQHYVRPPTPPPPPPKKTLDDIEGGREEITEIFDRLDTDRDGLVRMKSLEPMLQRIGISRQEVDDWITQLPSNKMQRCKSKIDAQDLEHLLAPSYVARIESPVQKTRAQIERDLEWNRELYLDVIGAH